VPEAASVLVSPEVDADAVDELSSVVPPAPPLALPCVVDAGSLLVVESPLVVLVLVGPASVPPAARSSPESSSLGL
jgi:hypothetical protein